MTSPNPEKSNVAQWDFLRRPGGGLVAASANAVRKRQDPIKYVGVEAATLMAPRFARHIGQLGAALGTCCIRRKLSAHQLDRAVQGPC
jgi:hypothetical protein